MTAIGFNRRFFASTSARLNQTDLIPVKQGEFSPKKVVVLRKLTRYEYEQTYWNTKNDDKLKPILKALGSNFDGLVQRHDEYCTALDKILQTFKDYRIDAQVVDRSEYDENLLKGVDAVFSAGGDGTFLLAASKIFNQNIPLIGITTDPLRSEGYLCIPKSLSRQFDKALGFLLSSKFKWMFRNRIRLTMSGRYGSIRQQNLHDQHLQSPENRFLEHVQENELHSWPNENLQQLPPTCLPIRALNEVFIGETLSSRVSFYEMSVNDETPQKQKSSGITICTGTGSSSWYFNINHLSRNSVENLLKIVKEENPKCSINTNDELLIRKIARKFNQSLIFSAWENKMAYTVRDPVLNGIFQVSNPKGFCQKMRVKSRMWDACVVIDGGVSYSFNEGAIVEMSMLKEDALKTVSFL
ncbi:DgyrCDS897 [Dimorphilus gyrociliatus]|uniref:DgyrCDS897 n=1 Tax=Dimorphilus gyrociliatus TaxID=2664684 RepID=A0A7I8V5N9_9ANNE|nr:DgyrCDS897 [Dimorphilus gyrociliatus]